MSCGYCNNGWIEHAPDPNRPAYLQSVPCTCVSPGNRLGIEAIRQQAEREAETREWVRKWEEAGKPSLQEIVKGVDFGCISLKDMTPDQRTTTITALPKYPMRDAWVERERQRDAARDNDFDPAREAAELETE